MKRYKVTRYYTSYEDYFVDAEGETEAERLVNSFVCAGVAEREVTTGGTGRDGNAHDGRGYSVKEVANEGS